MELDLEVPIQTMLALIYEIELWNHWAPFIKQNAEVFLLILT